MSASLGLVKLSPSKSSNADAKSDPSSLLQNASSFRGGHWRKRCCRSDVLTAFTQVGERFKCLSYTLEMPFKDTQDHPDNVHGWSTDRAKHFGAAILQPIYEVVPKLRQPVEKEKGVTVVHA